MSVRMRTPWEELLLAAALWHSLPGGLHAATLATDGTAQAVIVTAPDADPPEQHAAAELAGFLGQVTGGDFRVVRQREPGLSNLLVGPEAARMVDPTFRAADLGTDGMVVRTVGDDLILAGGRPRGTLYAVYTFLEDTVGCRWWTYRVSTIPRKPTLTVENLHLRYVPPFEYRQVAMEIATDPDWSVRNKCLGETHGINQLHRMPERGGCLKFWPTCHSFFLVIPPEKYFPPHPEWFSLINGKRYADSGLHSSLCLTNEPMRQEFVRNLKAVIRQFPQSYAALGAPDDAGFPCRCQCPECVVVEQEEGSPAGLLVRFANAVAADLEPEFPDLRFSVLAYHHTRKPPRHARPRRNVFVQLCAIECSSSKPLNDERNRTFREDLIGWTKVCPRVFVWDYQVNFTYPLLPHPNLRLIGPNVRFYAAQGVKGVWADGLTYGTWPVGAAEMRAWVWAKLLWNPTLDDQALMREFAEGYWGPAGKHVLASLDVFSDAVDVSGDWLGLSSPPDARFLSFATLNQSWAHLQAAEAAVAGSPEFLARVQVEQLPVLFAFLVRWNEMRDAAASRGENWPLSASIEAVWEHFRQVVEANGLPLAQNTRDDLAQAVEKAQTPWPDGAGEEAPR